VRAGRLDRLISIQRKSVTRSNTGQEIVSWVSLATQLPASVAPLRGDERFNGAQIVSQEQFEFTFRWFSAISDLSVKDRIAYPSNDSPGVDQVYDIVQVGEIGRREGFKVVAFKGLV